MFDKQALDALKAQHGEIWMLEAPRYRVLDVEADPYQVVVRRLTVDEWQEVTELVQQEPAEASEHALRLARVAPSVEELERMLGECPPLGEEWGDQVAAIVGNEPRIIHSGDEMGVQVLGQEVAVAKWRRPTRVEWKELTRLVMKEGQMAGALRLYDLCFDGFDKAALRARWPALPAKMGQELSKRIRPQAAAPRFI
jgi:hypothetical protein